MDKTQQSVLSFEDAADPLSRILLSYLSPLFRLGSQRPLQHDDLGPLSREDACHAQHEKFARAWVELTPDTIIGWKLGRVLLRAFGIQRFLLAMSLYLVMAAAQFGPVMILNALVSHFEGSSELSTRLLWTLIALMAVLPMVGSLCSARHTVIMTHFGLSIRNSLILAIYHKSLKISVGSRKVSSTGKIVNMFASDTQQLERLMNVLALIFIAPLQIAVALFLIYRQIGVATFVGLGVMILFAPISAFIFGALAVLRRKASAVTDSRVKLMNEIMAGIRLVKYFAWEVPFKEKVNEIRKSEIDLLRRIAVVVALGFSMIMLSLPLIQPILVFYTYVRLGNNLDSAKAFTTLALFSVIRFPFAFLPMGLSQLAQSKIASERILSFLLSPSEVAQGSTGSSVTSIRMYCPSDSNREVLENSLAEVKRGEVSIQFVDATIGWELESTASKYQPEKVENTAKEYVTVKTTNDDDAGPSVELVESSMPFRLTNLNLCIKRGELVAVIGSVGSGKTSFLNAILGEIEIISGAVGSSGTFSYCDQRPWIMNATLRDNVLFGSPYDEDKFDLAVGCVSLDEDINLLPGGVMTEIGERGINLSGGQKARVALARAVYRAADINLLDDPLSAVDAYVGRELFNECIVKAMAGSTRILVTHQVHLLTQADRVLVFDEGVLIANGSHAELLAAGVDIGHYIPEVEIKAEEEDSPTTGVGTVASEAPRSTVSHEKHIGHESEEFKVMMLKRRAASTLRKQDSRSSAIVSKEEKAEGSVSFAAYNYYIQSGGYVVFFLLISVTCAAKGFDIGSQFYLAYWNAKSRDAEDEQDALSSQENLRYLEFYAMLLMLGVASFVVRSLAGAAHRLGAAYFIHRDILNNILVAPVSFFDITPIGRILNRFSSDMATVDFEIGPTIIQYLNCVVSVAASVTAISVSTKGIFLILLIPLMLLFYTWKNYFLKSNTELKRLINISRSPIYADFSTALGGIVTIRAFGDEVRFIDGIEAKVNVNTAPSILSYTAVQWLSVRLDCNGALISFFIAALAASTAKYDFVPPGYLALALSLSFEMTLYLRQAVNMAAQFEAQMNSVERIRHYTLNVPAECDTMPPADKSLGAENSAMIMAADAVASTSSGHDLERTRYLADPGETSMQSDVVLPPAEWPDKGAIQVKDLRMCYRNGPDVLKGVSFDVAGGSKIGIVGRTGSGKSSLMVGCGRVHSILVPHVVYTYNSKVPLATLRSRLNIIPQDPVMFSASLRFNLDPFSDSTDQQIWDVLEAVTIKDFVEGLPNKLDEHVSEGGDNFSAGQRQIFCIARVLLKNPKVIVLDEATASIDNETDSSIQNMIRQRFKDSTVLTIAHRLHTIVDSDKIVVMDSGVIAEMGTADELNKNENGLFHALWSRQIESEHGKSL